MFIVQVLLTKSNLILFKQSSRRIHGVHRRVLETLNYIAFHDGSVLIEVVLKILVARGSKNAKVLNLRLNVCVFFRWQRNILLS